MPPVVTADIENCPCAFGSGKFGSPCERTQAANFVICRTLPRTSANDDRPATFPDDALEVPDAPPLFVPVVGVLVVEMLATDADVDPPHPVPSNERPTGAPTDTARRTLGAIIASKGSTPA